MEDNIIKFKKPNRFPHSVHIGWCMCLEDNDETVWYDFNSQEERDLFLFAFSEARTEDVDYKVFNTEHYYRDGVWHEGTVLDAEGREKALERLNAMSIEERSECLLRHLPRQTQIVLDDYLEKHGALVIYPEDLRRR